MKCETCGKGKVTYKCLLCSAVYCKQCAGNYEQTCECVSGCIQPIK